jgi:hypothetical protein
MWMNGPWHWIRGMQRGDALVALALTFGVAIVIWPAGARHSSPHRGDGRPTSGSVVGYVVSVDERHLTLAEVDGRHLDTFTIPRSALPNLDLNHVQEHIGLSVPTRITFRTRSGHRELLDTADEPVSTEREQARADGTSLPLTKEQFSWLEVGMNADEGAAIVGSPSFYSAPTAKQHISCGYWAKQDGPRDRFYEVCIDRDTATISSLARNVPRPKGAPAPTGSARPASAGG